MTNRNLLMLLVCQLALLPTLFSQTSTSKGEQIRSNLYVINADASTTLYDGNLTAYADSYSNDIDGMDARKMTNFTENLGMSRGNVTLVIERRETIESTDTIFYKMWQMQRRNYQLQFISANLNHPGLSGFLEDNFLNTRTPVELNGVTTSNFTITANTASGAVNRFRIVFESAAPPPLPITFSSLTAYKQNYNIAVDWTVENEFNVKEYEIQKSMNGIDFSSVLTVPAKLNNKSSVNYQWIDANPGIDNFYRIRSMSMNGEVLYSNMTQVSMGIKQDIVIYPNPVVNGIVNLQLVNQAKGNYGVRVVNNFGQVLQVTQIHHESGSALQTILLNRRIVKGTYHLQIIKPDNTTLTRKIFLQ